MKIWLINQYNMPPELGHFNRHYNLAKYLKKLGHEPIVFVGSYLHNTGIQMIQDTSLIKKYENSDCDYYFIKTCAYGRSKIKRIYAMFEFYFNLMKAIKTFEKPDVVLGSSAHPLAAVAANKLKKVYNCLSLVEVRDLWPAVFVDYGIVGRKNILLPMLYAAEKWIYNKADKLIFTFEGGKDYIIDKGWDINSGGVIDIDKVYYLNNGVDLEVFNYNKKNHIIEDDELKDDSIFKIIYTGSIGDINAINSIVEVASELQILGEKHIKIIIYGDGQNRIKLEDYCAKHDIKNIIFKGRVNKKNIPYILSKSNLNIIFDEQIEVLKYGSSANKMFDYMASAKPIISNVRCGYDLILKHKIGFVLDQISSKQIATKIIEIKNMPKDEYDLLSSNALEAAKEYDFSNLTRKLITIIEGD